MGQIITIRKNDLNKAEGFFNTLMSETETVLNNRAKQNKWQTTSSSLTSSTLEKEAENAIREACKNVPEFDANEVKLISGHKFPDILAETYYGVEVKSTNSDKWTSTGSSIVESTRIKTVESIYMLFGKLGGQIQFKCRPYKDVMYDIAVTHSPRYLIDMELNTGDTIFDKMNCDYDVLRKSSDAIKKVKEYYKGLKKRGQMPWWMDDNVSEPLSISITVRLWNTLSIKEKFYLKSLLFVLFPEVVNRDYSNAALWLASAKGIVVPNIRDLYSAGGTVNPITWRPQTNGVPRIWKTIVDCKDEIKNIMQDNTVLPFIKEYNPAILKGDNAYIAWVEQIDTLLESNVVNGKEYFIKEILQINS